MICQIFVTRFIDIADTVQSPILEWGGFAESGGPITFSG